MNHPIAGHADGVRRLVNNFPPNVYAAYVTDTQYRLFSLACFIHFKMSDKLPLLQLSRYIDFVTYWATGQSRFDFRQEQGFFCSS
jgi:hypothetical protein